MLMLSVVLDDFSAITPPVRKKSKIDKKHTRKDGKKDKSVDRNGRAKK